MLKGKTECERRFKPIKLSCTKDGPYEFIRVQKLKVEIVNVVATAELGDEVDLGKISELNSITYDPSRYFCAYFSDEKMESKVSVFSSGKMISVGGKSMKAARHDLMYVRGSLLEHGFVENRPLEVILRNLVATVDTHMPIELEELAIRMSGAVYEPEQFPGIIFRPKTCDCSTLIFSSGKLVVSGLREEDNVVSTCKDIVDEIGSY